MVCADKRYATDSQTLQHHHATSALGTVHYLAGLHVPRESCAVPRELYRIVDFCEQRDIMEQLFGLKTVSIYSGDRTNPKLDIYGVKEKVDVVGIIRERVEYNKQRRGVYEITNR